MELTLQQLKPQTKNSSTWTKFILVSDNIYENMEKKTEHNKADFWVKTKMQLIKIIVHTGDKVETESFYIYF